MQKRKLKLHALKGCAENMSIEKRFTIFKAFVVSQFSYLPLVWMFHSKELNNPINGLHERALRITY